MTTEGTTRFVGPIISDTRIGEAVARAVATDNDSAPIVEDRGAYCRIQLPTMCRLTRATLEEELGEEMPLTSLEGVMPSFGGRIRMTDNEIVWYLEDKQ